MWFQSPCKLSSCLLGSTHHKYVLVFTCFHSPYECPRVLVFTCFIYCMHILVFTCCIHHMHILVFTRPIYSMRILVLTCSTHNMPIHLLTCSTHNMHILVSTLSTHNMHILACIFSVGVLYFPSKPSISCNRSPYYGLNHVNRCSQKRQTVYIILWVELCKQVHSKTSNGLHCIVG